MHFRARFSPIVIVTCLRDTSHVAAHAPADSATCQAAGAAETVHLITTRAPLFTQFSIVKLSKPIKMSGKSKAFTKEEELLLQDFSRNVSTKSSALFYGNALIVSAIPICKLNFFCFTQNLQLFWVEIVLNTHFATY